MKIQIGTEIRDMTAEERANHDRVLEDQSQVAGQIVAAEAAKESAKAKLIALGLTEAEITALLGL